MPVLTRDNYSLVQSRAVVTLKKATKPNCKNCSCKS